VTETRPYHHGDLPSALLDAVDGLLREGGLDAVSLRAAARRAGVSHAAPAHHFGDKAGLLAAYASQGFERFAAVLRDARDGTAGTGEDRLRAMALAYLGFVRDERPRFEVMFRPELIGEHRQDVHDVGAASFAVLADEIAACLDETATEEDVGGLALSAWSSVHGLAMLTADGVLEDMEVSAEAATAPVLATLLAGMRAHPLWRGHER
jgi:AcrR family transcriptional regulator